MLASTLAQLPRHLEQVLTPFVGPLPWREVDLFIQRIPRSEAQVHVVLDLTVPHPHALTAVAMTIGTDIYIDPRFAAFETAAGLALRVHAAVPVRPSLPVPNFLLEYNLANRGVSPDAPWDNPYELEAYLAECLAFDEFMDEGLPRGRWLPLGKIMGFCDVEVAPHGCGEVLPTA